MSFSERSRSDDRREGGFRGRGGRGSGDFSQGGQGGRGGYSGDRGNYSGGRGGYSGGRGDYSGDRGNYSGGRGGYSGGRSDYSGGRGGRGDDRGGYRGSDDRGGYRGGYGREDRQSFGRGDGGRGGRGGGRGGGGAAPVADYPEDARFQISTNLFRISPVGDALKRLLYKHMVEIVNTARPTERPKIEFRHAVMEKFMGTIDYNRPFAYDGDHILITLSPLREPVKTIECFGRSFDCTVSFQSEHNLSDVHMGSRPSDQGASLLDIILQAAAKLSHEKVSRAKYIPYGPSNQQLIPLPGFPGKDIIMGHSQSVQGIKTCKICIPGDSNNGNRWDNGSNPYQQTMSTMMGFQVGSASIIGIRRQSLQEYLSKSCRYNILDERTARGSGGVHVQKAVRHLKVETHYIPVQGTNQKQKRTYKVESINFDETPRSFSFPVDEVPTTLYQYYQDRYSITLRYPNSPLVLVNKKNNTYLPAELVDVSQQVCPTAATEKMKSCLADAMCMEPLARKQYIENTVADLYTSNDVLDEFGLQLDKQMCMWNAKMLTHPLLEYKDGIIGSNAIISFPTSNSKGAWNMRDKAFLDGKALKKIGLIDTTRELGILGRSPALDGFVEEFKKQLRKVKMTGEVHIEPFNLGIGDIPRFKEDLKKKGPAMDLQLIVVLLPRKEVGPYKAVKSNLDDFCATQCLVVENTPGLNSRKPVEKGAGHLCNILAKINQKLVGVNHRLSNKSKILQNIWYTPAEVNNVVIVGVNMSNPQSAPKGNLKFLPSVCSMVVSANADFSIWIHSIRVQKRGAELIENIDEMLKDCLIKRSNYLSKGWPRKIIFMRDGVSEGQMEDVVFNEANSIKTMYTANEKQEPEISIFVAVKNHQTRFWTASDGGRVDPRCNLGPGTVVLESGVHLSRFPNFYLLSHAGIKGTSRPVRYFILKDDIGADAGFKAKLSSNQSLLEFWATFLYHCCYIYQRCQRAVCVPAPIYYADQLAQRGRIIASPLIFKKLGIEMLSDTDSDTFSLSSGGARDSLLATVNDEGHCQVLQEVNRQLKGFTANVKPGFYC